MGAGQQRASAAFVGHQVTNGEPSVLNMRTGRRKQTVTMT